jgi:hypothetical protein
MAKTSPKYVVLWRESRKGDPVHCGSAERHEEDTWTVYEFDCTSSQVRKAVKEILQKIPKEDAKECPYAQGIPDDIKVFCMADAVLLPPLP